MPSEWEEELAELDELRLQQIENGECCCVWSVPLRSDAHPWPSMDPDCPIHGARVLEHGGEAGGA